MSALMTSMCIFRNVKPVTCILGCQFNLKTHRRTVSTITVKKKCVKADAPLFRKVQYPFHLQKQFQSEQTKSKSILSDYGQSTSTQETESSSEHESSKQTKSDFGKTNQENKQDDDKGPWRDRLKNWKEWNWKQIGIRAGLCLGALTIVDILFLFGSPEIDAEGKEVVDEYSKDFSFIAYVKRTYNYFFTEVELTMKPSREKLLPDPLQYPYMQPKYTLVLELNDVLIHPEWNWTTGWRFKKRLGLDMFLRLCGPPTFELVIYTKDSGMTADPIISKIDPENFIMFRLYRDATNYIEGKHVKDLNCLNRDLSKVIFIDWNKDAYALNRENGLSLKQWHGEDDTVLGELAEFLRALVVSNVEDVRPVLTYYSQFDDPMAKFHENQAKLREEQEKMAIAQRESSQKGKWFKTSFYSK